MPYVRKTAAENFSQITNGEEEFFIAKGNFLDDFYSADDEERVRMVKTPIDPKLVTPEIRQFAAYFAAMVEHLSWAYDLACPAWVQGDSFYLPEPWFTRDSWRFRAWQLVTTAPNFARHNIWSGDDSVSRDGRGPKWTEHQWDWDAFERGENDVVLTIARGRARKLGVAFWYKDKNGHWAKENPNGVAERWQRE